MKSLTRVLFLLSLGVAVGCGDDSNDTENGDAPSRVETVAALNGSAASGAETYDSVCTQCHGPDGTGMDGVGDDLTVSMLSRVEIVDTVINGRGGMVGYSYLEDQTIADVTAYVLELRE